jgi:predicted phage terminase large subunit-like protein
MILPPEPRLILPGDPEANGNGNAGLQTPGLGRIASRRLAELGANYKLTPATMAHKLNPRWYPAAHLMAISLRIAKAIAAGNARIIISVPPRHGKSELITKYTTIWTLEHFPHWMTILATYGAELSTDFGREVRDIIQANSNLLDVRIKQDIRRVANWKTQQGGGMAAVGIGGPITGRGADVLLIDDYIKEIKEAMSKAHKDYIWDWFRTTAYTRIEPGGSCIIIATRWARDDLIGRILDSNLGDVDWQYIRFPALAEADDILGRQPGEALFPKRYDEAALHAIKETLGSFFFNSLYQQDPQNSEHALTDAKWLKLIDILPPLVNCKKARIWDMAGTQDGGDYTVGTHMIHDKPKNSTYITNVKRRRMSPQGVESLVRATAIDDGLDTTIYIEQEPGSSGKALVEYYANTVLPEFTVEAVPHNDGKTERAQPFLAAAEAGRIYLLKGSWNEEFISEFGRFPDGDHDDQIDTAAIGFTKLSGKKTFSASWGRRMHMADPNRVKIGGAPRSGAVFGRRRAQAARDQARQNPELLPE